MTGQRGVDPSRVEPASAPEHPGDGSPGDSLTAAEQVQALAAIQQLTLEAGLAENCRQLAFRILNRTILLARYDRAVLWELGGSRPRLLGISGLSTTREMAPVVQVWQRLVRAMGGGGQAAILSASACGGQAELWEQLAEQTGGLSVAWIPIRVDGETVAGLWLERWDGEWRESERRQLASLGIAYGIGWRAVRGPRQWLRRALGGRTRLLAMLLLILSGLALFGVRLPLRIVAPCEVVARTPIAIAAPLQGVLAEIVVAPGETVEAGQLLALYDKRVEEEELNIARQQVEIVRSQLERVQKQGMTDIRARADIGLLTDRLAQEEIRLRIAEYRVSRLEITAPVGGTVLLDDPNELRGKAVLVGERVMVLVDTNDTEVVLWLPADDKIDVDAGRPMRIMLGAEARTFREARLSYVAKQSQLRADGAVRFRARGEWIGKEPAPPLGMQGSAILYGEEVPLGYWLFRRPFAAIRRALGI